MSFMKGDLLRRTQKLVKGFAKAEPVWLKAMEHAPPATFPRAENKIKPITLPEDVYVKKFFKKNPYSLPEDPIDFRGFDPPPARLFGCRVVELKEKGADESDAMAVAQLEYQTEKSARKKAYRRLKKIARLQGKEPPPNPYPKAYKEIQEEERPFVRERFNNHNIIKIAEKLKEEREAELRERGVGRGGGRW
ncbi:unnamed protein product [Cuscuta campestris]|uniref:Small ribosomal subunit protein mS23 n=2 Tax=Cuscuta sect. Cleistogrammica TaxID=1824901 RepID=A0A484LL65_9ASTE|nr:hypothetical protein DM860_004190 [Cuscuta australis]VFQ77195.1 unnamed protein product [Cuscuta campestris]